MRRKIPSTAALAAAMDFHDLGKDGNRYMKFTVMKALRDLAGVWETRASNARNELEAAKKEGKPAAGPENALPSK